MVKIPQVPSSLQHFNIPPSKWLSENSTYKNLAVGACIFHPDNSNTRVLLIQRASTDSYPNRWECPGGGCDFVDSSILLSTAREVHEETGLFVLSFVRQVKAGKNADEDIEFFGKGGEWAGEKWRKVCFTVEVDNAEVVLDAKEHQAWRWASRTEVEEAEMVSEESKQVVRNAFTFWEASRGTLHETASQLMPTTE